MHAPAEGLAASTASSLRCSRLLSGECMPGNNRGSGHAQDPPRNRRSAIRVQDLMSRPLETCWADDSLWLAARKMWDHDIGALPVLGSHGRVTSVITDRDIARSHVAPPGDGSPRGVDPHRRGQDALRAGASHPGGERARLHRGDGDAEQPGPSPPSFLALCSSAQAGFTSVQACRRVALSI